jgi:hypothetical protein
LEIEQEIRKALAYERLAQRDVRQIRYIISEITDELDYTEVLSEEPDEEATKQRVASIGEKLVNQILKPLEDTISLDSEVVSLWIIGDKELVIPYEDIRMVLKRNVTQISSHQYLQFDRLLQNLQSNYENFFSRKSNKD